MEGMVRINNSQEFARENGKISSNQHEFMKDHFLPDIAFNIL